jgi:SAM-dependent methyltransferase
MEAMTREPLPRWCCPACGERLTNPGQREPDGPGPGRWVECARCTLLYESPACRAEVDVAFAADRGVLPDDATFDPTHPKIARVLGGDVQPWRDLYDHIERRFAQHGVTNRKLLIEVGCGAGEVIEYISGPRYAADRIVGFEISRACVAFLRSRGREVYYHDLAEAPPIADLEGRAGIIIANEVMEHVRAPRAFLDGVKRYLAPDGLVWLKFARADSLPVLHTGEWHYWTLAAAARLLETSGFAILSTFRAETYFDAVVKHADPCAAAVARRAAAAH